MNKYLCSGGFVEYTPSGANVAAGDVVIIGDIVGVATYPIADGVTGTLATEGVFELSNAGSASFSQGDVVCWNTGNKYAATSGTPIGTAYKASTGGTVLVKLSGCAGAQVITVTKPAALTDSSGGTAGATLAAVAAEYSQSGVANAIASLNAQINAVISALVSAGVFKNS